MSLIQAPQVVGLAVCDKLEPSTETGLISLVGIVQALRFRQFPSPPQRFTVYAALSDGVGEGKMKLGITRLESDQEIYYYETWFTFPEDRLLVLNLVISVTKCVFPAPGRYAFTLSFDNQFVTERSMPVFRSEG